MILNNGIMFLYYGSIIIYCIIFLAWHLGCFPFWAIIVWGNTFISLNLFSKQTLEFNWTAILLTQCLTYKYALNPFQFIGQNRHRMFSFLLGYVSWPKAARCSLHLVGYILPPDPSRSASVLIFCFLNSTESGPSCPSSLGSDPLNLHREDPCQAFAPVVPLPGKANPKVSARCLLIIQDPACGSPAQRPPQIYNLRKL